jgi:flagellar protein FlaG
MFETVNNIALNRQGNGNATTSQSAIPLQSTEKTHDREATSENVVALKTAEQKAAEATQAEEGRQVTEEMLKELEQDIQAMHNVGLRFSKHNDSGRTIIKVLDKENDQVIREIPAEDVLNLAAKMEEMIGILFDKEV